MLLADAVAAYVTDRHGRGEINAKTAKQLGWRLSLLARIHPGLHVEDLTRAHVLAWQRTTGDQKPATRRGYLSTLKTFCAWAIDNGLLAADPTIRLARVKDTRGIPRALSPGRMARLQMVLPDERARLIVLPMRQCGLRCIEVARLDVTDWDSSAGELRIIGKGGHIREQQVLDDLAALLDRYCTGRTGPLIGITAERISLLVSTWMDQAGLKTGPYDGISAHALRHTAASSLLDGCGNVRLVQEFLGHASLATTERYLRKHSKSEMRAAMIASDAVIRAGLNAASPAV